MSGGFATTQWSQVLEARDRNDTRAHQALEVLCQTYWYPLYAYIRRLGENPESAQDLTQAYFTRFLEKDFLKDVDPAAGRFRSFLLSSLRHFLSHERQKARAQKRGGDTVLLSLDTDGAESRYTLEPVDHLTPEQLFERQWALAVLERALEILRREWQSHNEGAVPFERLRPYLVGEEPRTPYRVLAADVNKSEPSIRKTVHGLRRRFGHHLRSEIADTVADRNEVDAEIRHLLAAIKPWEPQPP